MRIFELEERELLEELCGGAHALPMTFNRMARVSRR